MNMRLLAALPAFLLISACGERPLTMDEFRSMEILLPGGQKVLAETMRTELEMTRGMMFRDSLPRDHGMLFVHGRMGNWSYYMFQVKIPLDIVWMNADKQIVEISPKTPACTSKSARECPVYGGKTQSQYVLELPSGAAEEYGLNVGGQMKF